MEQENILQHDADLPAQVFQPEVPDVGVVKADLPGADIIEARDQAGQGGLAHAGRPHQCDDAVGRDLQVDLLQHRVALTVTEVHVAERQGAARTAGQCDRVRGLRHLRLLLQQLGHPVTAGQRLLNALPRAAQHAHGLVEEIQIKEKRHQVGDGESLLESQPPAEVDHHNGAQRRSEIDERFKGRHQPQRLQERIPVAVDMRTDAQRLAFLLGECLDLPDAGEVIVQRSIQFAQLRLPLAEGRPHVAAQRRAWPTPPMESAPCSAMSGASSG